MIPPYNLEHAEAEALNQAIGAVIEKYHMQPKAWQRRIFPQENGDVVVRTVIISDFRHLTLDACLRLSHEEDENDKGF